MIEPESKMSNPGADTRSRPHTILEIREWLYVWLEAKTGINSDSFDSSRNIIECGLDSLDAVTLSADLEDWLGCKFAPSLAYEHPTIDALAEELWRVISLGQSADRQIENGDVSAQQGAAEDFDLHDFVSRGVRLTLHERVTRFLELSESHRAGYRREVLSAPGREVEVLNRATGRSQRMLMFGSNNYLGLATHPHVRKR